MTNLSPEQVKTIADNMTLDEQRRLRLAFRRITKSFSEFWEALPQELKASLIRGGERDRQINAVQDAYREVVGIFAEALERMEGDVPAQAHWQAHGPVVVGFDGSRTAGVEALVLAVGQGSMAHIAPTRRPLCEEEHPAHKTRCGLLRGHESRHSSIGRQWETVAESEGESPFGQGLCAAESGGNHCHLPWAHPGWHRDSLSKRAWPPGTDEFLPEKPAHCIWVCRECAEEAAARQDGKGGWQLDALWGDRTTLEASGHLLEEHRMTHKDARPWQIEQVKW